MKTEIFTYLLAYVLTWMSATALKPLAIRIQLIDSPGGRKHHTGDIPLVGGVAIFLGYMISLLTLDISLSSYRSYIAASALLVFVGILDDFKELSARLRFVFQIIAGVIITVWGGVVLYQLGDLFSFGTLTLGFLAIPLTVFAVIGVINAVNMTDGVDGLAGSISLMQILLLSFLAWYLERPADLKILSIFSISLLGFLSLNFPLPWRRSATVFMGDAGSMFIGLTLVWFLMSLSQGPASVSPVVMLWIMTVPLFDIFGVMLRRVLEGGSPFLADRKHVHHALQHLGFSAFQVSFTLSIITLLLGSVGIAGAIFNISDAWLFFMWVGLFLGYFVWSYRLWERQISVGF